MFAKPQPVYPAGFDATPSEASRIARRGNLRRLWVFVLAFGTVMLLGQAWNLTRSELYRASSRLQIVVPDVSGPLAASAAAGLSTQAQVLTARPLLAKVAGELVASGSLPGPVDDATVSRLQAMLTAQPAAGTDVVVLQAVGAPPALLADLLNALPDVYRRDIEERQRRAADAQVAGVKSELAKLEATVLERRARLERYRHQAGSLSEREDNEAMARSKGLNIALNNAIEREAAVQARLQAAQDGLSQGRSGGQSREDAGVQALDARANQVREDLREMDRTYTAEFMSMDPRARALRARLAELERQLALQRAASRQTNLDALLEDAATARATTARLRAQLAAERPALRSAAGTFVQAKSIEDDLAQVERARRDAIERLARLEADERRRQPSVTVLEAALAPTAAFSPDYRGDGLWVLGAALLAGLLATGLVEIFNRAAPPSSVPGSNTLVLPGSWAQAPMSTWQLASGAGPAALPGAADPRMALPAPSVPSLDQAEAAALLSAAQGQARLACAFMLLGLTPEELIALRCADVDAGAGLLNVGGASARALELPAWLAGEAAEAKARAAPLLGLPLLRDANQAALTPEDVAAMVACASVDAGLPQGAGLKPEALRSTCIHWLVGQGLRFSDLSQRVGRMDPSMVASLAERVVAGPRRSLAETNCLMPALQLTPLA